MPKPKSLPQVHPRSAKLIAEFDAAAQNWGWERDEGYVPEEKDIAKIAYEKALLALYRHVARLERK